MTVSTKLKFTKIKIQIVGIYKFTLIGLKVLQRLRLLRTAFNKKKCQIYLQK